MADSTTQEKHIALDAMKEAQSWISSKKDEFIADMKAQLGEGVKKVIQERKLSLDNVLVAAICCVTGETAEKVATKLNETQLKLKSQNIDNIVLLATFYNLDTKYLFGDNKDVEDKKFPRRLDKVTKIVETDSGENGSSTKEVGFGLSWENVNSWDWPNFIEPLNINFTGNQKETTLKGQLSVFTKICYTYEAIRGAAGSSSFDSLNSDLAFPFLEDQLSLITYTSPFSDGRVHPVYGDVRKHSGVDLAAPLGTEIHAAADGVVSYAWPADGDGGGNRISIQHANGVYTAYMHMNDQICSVGQNIKKGDIIGHVGTTGASTGPHLHFQINLGGPTSDPQDPAKYFQRLGNCPLGTCLGSFNG